MSNLRRPGALMVARGELVASMGIPQWQLNLDPAGRVTITDSLDSGVQVNTPDGQALGVQRVNRPLAGGGSSLVVQTAAAQSIGVAPHLLSRGRPAFAPDEVGSFMQG